MHVNRHAVDEDNLTSEQKYMYSKSNGKCVCSLPINLRGTISAINVHIFALRFQHPCNGIV